MTAQGLAHLAAVYRRAFLASGAARATMEAARVALEHASPGAAAKIEASILADTGKARKGDRT